MTGFPYTQHSENYDINLLRHLLVPPLHQVVPVAETSQEEHSHLGPAQDSELLVHLLAFLVKCKSGHLFSGVVQGPQTSYCTCNGI